MCAQAMTGRKNIGFIVARCIRRESSRSRCETTTRTLTSFCVVFGRPAVRDGGRRRHRGLGSADRRALPGPLFRARTEEERMVKVEATVIRERVETVIDAVEEATGHVGVTVIEAIGHGRQRGVTHEYRGRIFESRFLPKALLVFVVEDRLEQLVVDAIVDSARSGNESGDGLVWTSRIENVVHHRTGRRLEEAEIGA